MSQLKKLNNLKKPSPIDTARRVLIQESKALDRMANELGQSFASAIEIFEMVKGRIVVSGMG